MTGSDLTPRDEQHGRFIATLGERLIWRYTDGGAGNPCGRRVRRRDTLGTGGRFARRVRRNRRAQA